MDSASSNQRRRKLRRPSSLYFDNDILMEILSLVPWKSLTRFKCVSKRWYNLIESPDLFRLRRAGKQEQEVMLGLFYQLRSGNETSLLSTRERLRVNFASIDEAKKEDLEEQEQEVRMKVLSCLNKEVDFLPCNPVYIHGCQNGLILCSLPKHNNKYFVCNPITYHFLAIPEPEIYSKSCRIGIYVAGDEFKVVRIPSQQLDNLNMKVQVYTSSTNDWKFINCDPGLNYLGLRHNFHLHTNTSKAVQAGESLYWLNELAIVGFDVVKESITVTRLPTWKSSGCLGVCRDTLRFARNYNGHFISVWELQLTTWLEVQTVEIRPMLKKFYPSSHTRAYSLNYDKDLVVIGFHCSKSDVIFVYAPEGIFSYNTSNKKAEKLTSLGVNLRVKPKNVFPYVLPKVPILGF